MNITMPLRFAFQEMLNEIQAFSGLAEEFIAPSSREVLTQFRQKLEGYRNSPTKDPFVWEIPEANPLTTISTKGYEPGRSGQKGIVGQISTIWEIKRDPPPKKSMPSKSFALIGLASTRIRLRFVDNSDQPAEEIGMWRMELGGEGAPGCFFHSQILGEAEDPPFPRMLSVPRLPIIAMSLSSVAEFVLGELFQDDWARCASLQVPQLKQWASIQKERFSRLLNWKLGVLQGSSGSPWPSLKAAQPDDGLFI